jgi:hypothetical protein
MPIIPNAKLVKKTILYAPKFTYQYVMIVVVLMAAVRPGTADAVKGL